MSQNIVVIGASRGIGLEMARLWHERGEHVIATCRQVSPALDALGVQVLPDIDVTTEAGLARLHDALGDTRIDILYHSAGILHDESLQHLNAQTIRQQFEVNTLAPLRTVETLLDRLADHAKIGLMTSRMGSIGDNDSGGRYGYRMSKAGLNAACRSLALDLEPRGIAVAILHPGFVKTDMTHHNGHLQPAEAAEQLIQRMDELTLANTGTFWHSDGSVLPW